MARYQVILVYDGTEFYGSQRQAAQRTVQGVVEQALQRIGWQGSSLLMAGRTDAGVHAYGQAAAFDLDWQHSTNELLRALNANLPDDVAVQQVKPVAGDHHPRYDASARRYHYRIFCQPHPDPLRERYAWRVWPAVDLKRMQQAADHLLGTHDFAAFGKPHQPGGPTVRNVSRALWVDETQFGRLQHRFEIEGNAFLYRMVRRIVFALVQVGQGLLEPETLAGYLLKPPSEVVQGLAPPSGLILVEVVYPS